MNLMPFIVSWAVLATAVLALIIYRRSVASQEDDCLHVDGGQLVQKQAAVAKKLETIDKWGKILTALAVVYALLIGALFMYNAWISSGTRIQG